MEDVKRIKRELVAKGHILDYYHDTVQIANGNVAVWDFIGHKGAAAVVPVLEDGRILMVKQYRNALDRFTTEIPAGGVDHIDEPHYDAAMRDLREEPGYITDKLELLIVVNTTVAFCNEKISIYVAHVSGNAGEQDLDEDEYINVIPYELEELERMIYAGEITDSKTVAAILAYKNKYIK